MMYKYELKTQTEYDLAKEMIRIANSPKWKYRVGIITGITFNSKKQPDKLVIEWVETKPWK